MPKVVVIFYYIDDAGEFQIFTAREGANFADVYEKLDDQTNFSNLYRFRPEEANLEDISKLRNLADFASATNKPFMGYWIPGMFGAPVAPYTLDDFIRGWPGNPAYPAYPAILPKQFNVSFPTRVIGNGIGPCRIYTETRCELNIDASGGGRIIVPKFDKTFPKGSYRNRIDPGNPRNTPNNPDIVIQKEVQEELNVTLDHNKYIKIGQIALNHYVYAYQCNVTEQKKLLDPLRTNAELSFCKFEPITRINAEFPSPNCQFFNTPANRVLVDAFDIFKTTIVRTAHHVQTICNNNGLNLNQTVQNARIATSSTNILAYLHNINPANLIAGAPAGAAAAATVAIRNAALCLGSQAGINLPVAPGPVGILFPMIAAAGTVIPPAGPANWPGAGIVQPAGAITGVALGNQIPAAALLPTPLLPRVNILRLYNIPNLGDLRITAIIHRIAGVISAPALAAARAAVAPGLPGVIQPAAIQAVIPLITNAIAAIRGNGLVAAALAAAAPANAAATGAANIVSAANPIINGIGGVNCVVTATNMVLVNATAEDLAIGAAAAAAAALTVATELAANIILTTNIPLAATPLAVAADVIAAAVAAATGIAGAGGAGVPVPAVVGPVTAAVRAAVATVAVRAAVAAAGPAATAAAANTDARVTAITNFYFANLNGSIFNYPTTPSAPVAAAALGALFPLRLGGNYKEKYLKYKSKYLELKNNLI